MADFRQVDEVRKVLDLGETATMKEIKEAYRRVSIRYHPDKCKDKRKAMCEELMKKVNQAYETIIAYCEGYEFSFKEEDVRKVNPDYDFMKRFYYDWMR